MNLKEAILQKRLETDAAHAKNSSLRKENEELRNSLETLVAANAKLQAEAKNLEEQNADLVEYLGTDANTVEHLSTDAELSEHVGTDDELSEHLESQNAAAEQCTIAVHTNYNILEKQNAILQSVIKEMKRNHQARENEFDRLNDKIAKLEVLITTLKSRLIENYCGVGDVCEVDAEVAGINRDLSLVHPVSGCVKGRLTLLPRRSI